MSENIIYRTRSGLGPAGGVRIDGFIDEKVAETLYERWNAEEWGAPIEHRGGTTVITCEMVASVGYSELSKTYGVRAAKKLITAAEDNQVTR
jgi:hypothetical protein